MLLPQTNPKAIYSKGILYMFSFLLQLTTEKLKNAFDTIHSNCSLWGKKSEEI